LFLEVFQKATPITLCFILTVD